jgi:hypothetical protein
MLMMMMMIVLIVDVCFRSARSAASNVAGKFDYGDVNDADTHAVSELQVRFVIVLVMSFTAASS